MSVTLDCRMVVARVIYHDQMYRGGHDHFDTQGHALHQGTRFSQDLDSHVRSIFVRNAIKGGMGL